MSSPINDFGYQYEESPKDSLLVIKANELDKKLVCIPVTHPDFLRVSIRRMMRPVRRLINNPIYY